jgi:CRP-like cAMP-binding protein
MMQNSKEQLKKIPLFSNIQNEELENISQRLTPENYSVDSVILNEGDEGTCLYLIKSGKVKVVGKLKDEKNIVLSELKPGDYFGEMALITGEARSATVIALTNVELWRLDKNDFDQFILSNPKTTLSLTHMLSQRLKHANSLREQREFYYQQKITPSGSIKDVNVYHLLKYAEKNALTGKIYFQNQGEQAVFDYEKGILTSLEYGDKEENEALDILLEWQEGLFKIEPKLYEVVKTPVEITKDSISAPEIAEQMIQYLSENLKSFVHYAGASVVEAAVKKAFFKFEVYFDFIANISIEIRPELRIEISLENQWEEKYTLFLAVMLRDIVKTIEREVAGINFWKVESNHTEIDALLNKLQFYKFYNEAKDFIKD